MLLGKLSSLWLGSELVSTECYLLPALLFRVPSFQFLKFAKWNHGGGWTPSSCFPPALASQHVPPAAGAAIMWSPPHTIAAFSNSFFLPPAARLRRPDCVMLEGICVVAPPSFRLKPPLDVRGGS